MSAEGPSFRGGSTRMSFLMALGPFLEMRLPVDMSSEHLSPGQEASEGDTASRNED